MERYCWRLAQVWFTCGGMQGYRGLPVRGGNLPWTWSVRNIGQGGKDHSDDGSGSDSTGSQQPLSPPQQLPKGRLFGRSGARRRPLSPLERVSQLLPPENLSQEVWELREGKGEEEGPGTSGNMYQYQQATSAGEVPNIGGESCAGTQQHALGQRQEVGEGTEEATAEAVVEDRGLSSEEKQDQAGDDPTLMVPGDHPLRYGELALAEFRKRRGLEFKKMFALTEGGYLHSSWGTVPHSAIVGRPAGCTHISSIGSHFLMRRPSLDEYVLYMKRAPTISYPKDANAMLMMMDVSEGDCVLESGSGSGAMSLFLSRAVGSRGRVLSVEKREDHFRRAVANYQRWRSVWSIRRGEEWPDNVSFHIADLQTSTALLAGQGFHSVIDLLEGIRYAGLPLLCERVVEVQLRDWLLAPAIEKKDGYYALRVAPVRRKQGNEEAQSNNTETDETRDREHMPFGSVPYIARPHHEQTSHTAFLVKLRKVLPP
ncbi:hypothetical protein JZ751_003165 [Albula glossodonta]|uniref:tRNA (adenine(58)-N(1))-methyltransferase n=1 Tax=Albula glossodonta TaxID=121402 RepID=A0A8T2NK71_9TELE|nr:hypothetical protein JZ751_003165 [Albula glossodonta]